jgi:protein TonB
MRAWTLGVSVVVHLGVICGVIVAPLFATGDVPAPVRIRPEWVPVLASLPDPPASRRAPSRPQPSRNVAPLNPPDQAALEPPVAETPLSRGVDIGLDTAPANGGLGLIGDTVPGVDPLPPPPAPPRQVEPRRVGGVVAAPTRLVYVSPKYPPLAQAARIQGIVILDAVIATDGTVRDVRALKSPHALLEAAAVDAVRQWTFTAPTLNGQAIPVVMTVTVSFTLP